MLACVYRLYFCRISEDLGSVGMILFLRVLRILQKAPRHLQNFCRSSQSGTERNQLLLFWVLFSVRFRRSGGPKLGGNFLGFVDFAMFSSKTTFSLMRMQKILCLWGPPFEDSEGL